MLRKAAVVSLVLLVLVSGAALYLLKPAPAVRPVAGTWLDALESAGVKSLSVRTPEGFEMTAAAQDLPDLWLMRWTEGGEERAWPVESTRVRALVRLVADLRSLPDAGAPAGGGAAVLSITLGDGSVRSLRIGGSELGGRTPVTIEGEGGRSVMADGAFSQLFAREGLLAWRAGSAFYVGAGEAARFSVETSVERFAASRNAGRWGLTSPASTPARSDLCASLLSRGAMMSVRPTAGPAPEPVYSILRTETDVRAPVPGSGSEVTRRVLVQTLRVGGPADARREHLLGTVSAEWEEPGRRGTTPAWGAQTVLVDRAAFEALPLTFVGLASPVATDTRAPDVMRVSLRRADGVLKDRPAPAPLGETHERDVTLTRAIDGWRIARGTSAPRAVAEGDTPALTRMLSLLGEAECASVSLEAPKGATAAATIELGGAGGAVLSVVELGVVPPEKPGAPSTIVVRTGNVYRVYAVKGLEPVLSWLAGLLPPEG